MRWKLYRLGLPVFRPEVFYAAGWNEYPHATVIAEQGGFGPAGREIMEWLDQTILRAPVVVGLDIQMVKLTVLEENGRVLAEQSRLIDKYGWRKEARTSMDEWLGETMAGIDAYRRVVIGAAAQSFGNMANMAKKELQGHG